MMQMEGLHIFLLDQSVSDGLRTEQGVLVGHYFASSFVPPARRNSSTVGVQLDSVQCLDLKKRERRRRANANLFREYVQGIVSMPLDYAR